MTRVVLAADVGGTNSRLALFDADDASAGPTHALTLASADVTSLEASIAAFVAGSGAADRLAAACIAIAGPVEDRKSTVTNLAWTVTADALAAALTLPTARVDLINDFVAVGHGVLATPPEALVTIQAGTRKPGGTIAILGAGTGLGEAFITFDEAGRARVHATEGGHADFAPRSRTELGVAEHIAVRFGRCSVERVVSGPGLVSIFEALTESLGQPVSDAVRDALGAEDPAAVISRFAQDGSDATCVAALDLFLGAYGAEAGNHALRTLATGGVVLAGGIAPRLIDRLRGPSFLEPFRQKGRFRDFCAGLAVAVAASGDLGLVGAARRARELAPVPLSTSSSSTP